MRKNARLKIAYWLGLIALTDFLFFRSPIGLNGALYFIILTVSVPLFRPKSISHFQGKLLMGTLFMTALALALEPSLLMLSLGLIQISMLIFLGRVSASTDVLQWFRRFGYFLKVEWLRPLKNLKMLKRILSLLTKSSAQGIRKLCLWVLPAALGLVFVALFLAANPILTRLVNDLAIELDRIIYEFFLLVAPQRIFFWVFAGYGLWIFLRGKTGELRKKESVGSSLKAPLDFTRRCLWVFNGVFLAQTITDVFYLWGGWGLPSGMSYAEYAHRGAYPLLFTALLSAGFILLSFPAGGDSEKDDQARALVYAWIAQNIFLCFNSIFRLALYVSSYQLTLLRVSAGVWILMVVAGFILIGIRISKLKQNGWLLKRNAMVVLSVFFFCGFLDIRGAVAWYNVTHCQGFEGEGAALDQMYLLELGPAALPAITWYVDRYPGGVGDHESIHFIRNELEQKLQAQLSDWRGATFYRVLWARSVRGDR